VKVLFCHDHRFVIGPDGAVLSRGQFSEKIVARYEHVFETLFVAGRVSTTVEQTDTSRLNVVFRDPSRFVPIASQSSIRALLLGDSQACRCIEAAIKSVDAVIIRLPSEIGLLAGKIARHMGKPLITEVVGCVWDAARSHGGIKARVYAPLAYARMRSAVAQSDWTLYVSERFLQDRYPARGARTAVSNVNLPPRDENTLARRLARVVEAPLVVGVIATMFNNQKRVDIMIRALSAAVGHGADLKFEVVGPGDTSGLQALAAASGVGDRVRFIGALPHGEKLFGWLDSIDLYVQTSFQEGLPRALIEAMSRALPALGSNVGGTNELLPHDCLHRPGDVTTLAQQLMAMRSPVRRALCAAQNFSRAGDFVAEKLDTRRQAFWRRFCDANAIRRETMPSRFEEAAGGG
jgi:glycosyltransferase involved in cell wall biosynthesis